MKINITSLACFLVLLVECKNKPKETAFVQWGGLEKGRYTVGYRDTVIFKADEKFSYFDYKGNKPFFVSIWYPALDDEADTFMSYLNYFEYPRKPEYGKLYDSLFKIFDNVIIREGITIDIKSFNNDLKFSDSLKALYNDIKQTKVNAKRNLVAMDGRFPCIFYHHGAGSNPIDDNVFFEYMASRGYVVVSSSYSLPDEKAAGELINSEAGDMAFMVKEAKKLINVDTTKMVAAGHSLGAQTEMLYDSCGIEKPFKRIISFHTTVEGFEGDLKIADKIWTSICYIWSNKCAKSTTPTFVFAPLLSGFDTVTNKKTGKIDTIKETAPPKFIPFRKNTTTPYTFITVNHDVTHDGFITFGNLRYPFAEKYNLPDKEEITSQQHYYEQIVLLADKIAKGAITNTPLPTTDTLVNKYFKIETLNK